MASLVQIFIPRIRCPTHQGTNLDSQRSYTQCLGTSLILEDARPTTPLYLVGRLPCAAAAPSVSQRKKQLISSILRNVEIYVDPTDEA